MMSKTEIFVSKAREIHGDKYDYSLVAYTNNREKVRIVCPEHGEFEQSPGKHLMGQGCKRCGAVRANASTKKTTEQFIEEAKGVHGDTYDYSESNYTGANDFISITCKVHGPFQQVAFNHLKGHRCAKCAPDIRGKESRLTQEQFLHKCKEVHGDRYDYSQSIYVKSSEHVTIVCRKHGVFRQTPNNHFNDQGCPECKVEAIARSRALTLEECLENFHRVHGDAYDYSLVKYVAAKEKVDIICKKHGVFSQAPGSHSSGNGCPKCTSHISKGQIELLDFIESLGVEIVKEYSLPSGKRLDCFIPSLQLGIEYNGLYYHSSRSRLDNHKPAGVDDRYHLEKTRDAASVGISLIHVWEDEWLFKRPLVESMLRSKLGKTEGRVFARKCQVTSVPNVEASAFLESTHLLGKGRSYQIKLGLRYNGTLVALLCADSANRPEGEIEITRYASNTLVVGGFSKLLAALTDIVRDQFKTIVSFSEDRLYSGEMYSKSGFRKGETVSPSYTYLRGGRRLNKRGFQRHLLPDVLESFDPNLSERDNCELNRIYQVWDCGKTKWILDL